MKRSQILFTTLCLITIYLLSVWVRLGICKTAEEKEGEIPFTMESAYLYYFSNIIAENKTVPLIDFKAQNPEGIDPQAKLSLTLDYALGWTYRHFFPEISYTTFLRIAQPIILCLSIFIVFGIAFQISHDPLSAIWASLLYAFSTSSILRSTGIEYSRENFALPLLFLHFSLLLADSTLLTSFLAAAALGCALTIWDGSQIYFTLWMILEILRTLLKKSAPPPPRQSSFFSTLRERNFIHLAGIIPLSLFHPYLRDHHFFFSPAMSGLYILSMSQLFYKHQKRLLLMLLPLGFALWLFSPYLETYHHMIQLILYKIKFLNVKPANPALLPFDVRVLWTPALHALAWDSLKNILPLLFIAIPGSFYLWKRRKPFFFFLLSFIISFFILTLAFVRLEVYCVFFLACLIGSLPLGLNSRGLKRSIFWNSCVFLVLLFEAEGITKDFSRFERPVPYPYLEGVVHWIGEHTPRQAIVLANFGLSPSFLAYSHRGIILQPKYESPDMRQKIEAFAKTLFEISEESFYNFCLKNEALYYVHAIGTFQDRTPFSWAYMANQIRPSKKLLAAQFEYGGYLKRFYPLYNNGKYRVYRVIWPREFRQAKELKNKGDIFFEEGQWEKAQEKYETALKLTPTDPMIYFRLAKVFKKTGLLEKAIQATKEGLKRVSPS